MKKPLITLFFAAASFNLSAQADNQLHDYVLAGMNKTRANFFERDSLVNPNFKRPDFSELSPLISVNKKSVDMEFLTFIAISDTISVHNRGDKLPYVSSGSSSDRITRKVIMNGMFSIRMDKKAFKSLWKIHGEKYPKKQKI